jgi:predicted RNase H-like HicB family nuclease
VDNQWLTTVHNGLVTHDVHVPYTVEQDEDGVWCAAALIRPGVGAVGDGATPEEAIADLRTALEVLLDTVGPPDELTVTLNVA